MNSHPWKLNKVVLPQHTDHAGIMWHGAYISWLEEARIKALSDAGLSYRRLSLENYEMPVVSLKINYIKAIFHGDEVLLSSYCLPRDGVRWPWKTCFLREGNVVAEARVDLVIMKAVIWKDETLGAEFEIKDIPDDLMEISKKYRQELVETAVEQDEKLSLNHLRF